MKRFGRTVMLKDDPQVIARYEDYHAHAWPETLANLRADGVQRMYIYRFGRQLFMYMETDDGYDLNRAAAPAPVHPRAREWEALMTSFQETVPGAPAGTTWVEMKEVFALPEAGRQP
jgi:L-rhamnose mutarotase